MVDVELIAFKLRRKELTGADLARMMESGEISKAERRKATKLAQNPPKELTERQQLRLAAKEKKQLPKLTKEDRRRKYVEEKLEKEREEAMSKTTVCLHCREKGHILKRCPLLTNEKRPICFNCGSHEHSLHMCPNPRDGNYLPFSVCFICKKNGHLSRDCPDSDHGLYPKGGCCHICLKKDHLVKDCPQKPSSDLTNNNKNDGITAAVNISTDITGGDDNVDYGELQPKRKKSKKSREE